MWFEANIVDQIHATFTAMVLVAYARHDLFSSAEIDSIDTILLELSAPF